MRHIDLFSGIGGFALAAQWTWGDNHKVVCFCEMDKFCQKVLNKHWSDVPIVEDVNDVDSILAYAKSNRYDRGQSREVCETESRWQGIYSETVNRCKDGRRLAQSKVTTPPPTNVDLLTGGFPCQPFSVAGKQGGEGDDRYLWPQTLSVIAATRPSWVLLENVPGIIKMALDTVLSDLEAEGYTCGTLIIPACAKNAPHRRDRVWIVGHTSGHGLSLGGMLGGVRDEAASSPSWQGFTRTGEDEQNVSDTELHGRNYNSGSKAEQNCNRKKNGISEQDGKHTHWKSKQRLGLRHDGFPARMVRRWGTGEWEEGVPRVAIGIKDRVNKLKALGNAVVPLIPYEIMKAIKEIEG